jgi:hypothetical protein
MHTAAFDMYADQCITNYLSSFRDGCLLDRVAAGDLAHAGVLTGYQEISSTIAG